MFLGIEAWTLLWSLKQVQIYPEVYSYGVLLATYVVNVSLVVYFLIPAVRAVYSNPRLRWWEIAPRYQVSLKVKLSGNWGDHTATLLNISQGGVLLNSSKNLEFNESGSMQIKLQNLDFSIRGRVVHRPGRGRLYGVQFIDVGEETAQQLQKLMQALVLLGSQERSEDPSSPTQPAWKDLLQWSKGVLQSGKGIVPQVSEEYLKAPEPPVSPTEQLSVGIDSRLTQTEEDPQPAALSPPIGGTQKKAEISALQKNPSLKPNLAKASRIKRRKIKARKNKQRRAA